MNCFNLVDGARGQTSVCLPPSLEYREANPLGNSIESIVSIKFESVDCRVFLLYCFFFRIIFNKRKWCIKMQIGNSYLREIEYSKKKFVALLTCLIGRLKVSEILRACGFRGLLDGVWTAQTLMKATIKTRTPTVINITAHQ